MNPILELLFGKEKWNEKFESDGHFMNELFRAVEFSLAESLGQIQTEQAEADRPYERMVYGLAQNLKGVGEPSEDLEAQWSFLQSYFRARVRKTEEAGKTLRFASLMMRKGLSDLAGFCLILAIYAVENNSSRELFTLINGNNSMDRPCKGTVGKLYFGKYYAHAIYYHELEEAMEEVRPILWAEECGESEQPLWADRFLIDYVHGRLDDEKSFREGSVETDIPRRIPIDRIPEQLWEAFSGNGWNCLYSLKGEVGSGRNLALRQMAEAHGLPVFYLDCRTLRYMEEREQRAYFRSVVKRIHVLDGVCCIREFESESDEKGEEALRLWVLVNDILIRWQVPVFFTYVERLSGELFLKLPVIKFALKAPGWEESQTFWRFFSENAGFTQKQLADADLQLLANQLKLTPGEIQRSVTLANESFMLDQNCDLHTLLMDSGVSASSGNLDARGSRIAAEFRWEDLILSETSKEVLKNACNQVKYRDVVLEKWNVAGKMQYGTGLGILLYGPPGTGKTMTAQIMARELALPLYRIDLSKVIDKYVGETEKNIGIIFKEARNSNAILFFDEADALFSKRSSVSSSNDRHANTETAYLLQCVEDYTGISILATNYQNNIDEAFKRRMKFTVEFPLPDCEARKKIWKSVFTEEMPIGQLDFDFLAESYELSGGSIKNVMYNSAFLAAAEHSPVEMKHLLYNIRQETVKNGGLFERSNYGIYEYLFEPS